MLSPPSHGQVPLQQPLQLQQPHQQPLKPLLQQPHQQSLQPLLQQQQQQQPQQNHHINIILQDLNDELNTLISPLENQINALTIIFNQDPSISTILCSHLINYTFNILSFPILPRPVLSLFYLIDSLLKSNPKLFVPLFEPAIQNLFEQSLGHPGLPPPTRESLLSLGQGWIVIQNSDGSKGMFSSKTLSNLKTLLNHNPEKEASNKKLQSQILIDKQKLEWLNKNLPSDLSQISENFILMVCENQTPQTPTSTSLEFERAFPLSSKNSSKNDNKDSMNNPQWRQWYLPQRDWVLNSRIQPVEESLDNLKFQKKVKKKKPSTEMTDIEIHKSKSSQCFYCHENFERYFSGIREEWLYRSTSFDKHGRVVHTNCIFEKK